MSTCQDCGEPFAADGLEPRCPACEDREPAPDSECEHCGEPCRSEDLETVQTWAGSRLDPPEFESWCPRCCERAEDDDADRKGDEAWLEARDPGRWAREAAELSELL